MLMTYANQAVSATDLQKKTREILDRVSSGSDSHLVVMRDSRPTAIVMSPDRYEAIMDELADLRIEAIARERLATLESEYVSLEEMNKFVDSL